MKQNNKCVIQRKVRSGLRNLGYEKYVNANTEKVIELLISLYPTCKPLEQLTDSQKKDYVFTKFLEIAAENKISLNQPVKKSKKQKKSIEEQNNKAIKILQKMGYIKDGEKKTRTELYYLIKEIHPELKAYSGAAYYIKRTFNAFIQIHSNPFLSEEEKQYLLSYVKNATIRKREKVAKKHNNSCAEKSYAQLRAEFYKSNEWLSLRYSVLAKYHGKCQLCGRCRKDGVILHVDHIVPLSKDWSKRLDEDNLQVLCEDCNLGKSNTDSIDWR